MKKLLQRMRDKEASVVITPHARGFAVEGIFTHDGVTPVWKRINGVKEGQVNDHYRTDLHRALDEMLDWLSESMEEGEQES